MARTKPYIIGVSGGSGVGKSVLSRVLARHIGEHQTTVISTDDLHKWERHDPNWSKFTHLNPDANDISRGVKNLTDLKSGKVIYRKMYDHSTGKHTQPLEVKPTRYIIHEGLHAFYGKKLSSVCDFKIFIETTDSLKRHWKIARDTQKRGYTPQQVEKAMRKRAADYEKYLLGQKKDADLVIFLSESKKIKNIGDPSEIIKVNTKIFSDTEKSDDRFALSVISFLKNDMADLKEFVSVSKMVGVDPELVTNSGGNTSLKTSGDKILIKASGSALSAMSYLDGYCHMNDSDLHSKITTIIDESDPSNGDSDMYRCLQTQSGTASMESGFHSLIRETAIIHTHPVYVLVLLCCKNADTLLAKIFSDFDYTLIDACAPGYHLTKKISDAAPLSNIIFLKNHGLIVGASSMRKAMSITKKLNQIARKFLEDLGCPTLGDFVCNELKIDGHLFPDSAVLNDLDRHRDTLELSMYVDSATRIVDKPDYLPDELISYIVNTQIEKDRRNK